jgi:Mor family transcriptional regulator
MSDFDLISSVIGEDAARKLCDKLGGSSVYIPKAPAKEKRNIEIKQEFTHLLATGSTCMNAYTALAKAHNVSVRRVQTICNY